MEAFSESLRSAFSETVAAKFFTARWPVLNRPGVSGSDKTSYVIRPRLINKELMRKSRFV